MTKTSGDEIICPECRRGLCIVIDDVHWSILVPFPPEVMRKFAAQAFASGEHSERMRDHWHQPRKKWTTL